MHNRITFAQPAPFTILFRSLTKNSKFAINGWWQRVAEKLIFKIKSLNMFIIDAHLDLSMNAMEWNRDLRNDVAILRHLEKGMTDKPDRERATVSFPDLRKGNIGIVVATQIARFVKPGSIIPGWNSPEQAWAQTQGQLAWYKAMEDAGEMVQRGAAGYRQTHGEDHLPGFQHV